jgi:hypothetical protein
MEKLRSNLLNGGAVMRKQWFGLALAGLILVTADAQRGQSARAQSSENEHARRSVAVNLLRAINTAEYPYKATHGTFASWDVLVTSEEFNGQGMPFATQNEPQLANAHFSKAPEVLPGWMLRLNVTSDGKGYDVLLEDETDKACGYAVVTNESVVIRQSKTIDCDI